jgi:hypothetical protein
MTNTILDNESDKCFGLSKSIISVAPHNTSRGRSNYLGLICADINRRGKRTRILQVGNDKRKKEQATKAEVSKK